MIGLIECLSGKDLINLKLTPQFVRENEIQRNVLHAKLFYFPQLSGLGVIWGLLQQQWKRKCVFEKRSFFISWGSMLIYSSAHAEDYFNICSSCIVVGRWFTQGMGWSLSRGHKSPTPGPASNCSWRRHPLSSSRTLGRHVKWHLYLNHSLVPSAFVFSLTVQLILTWDLLFHPPLVLPACMQFVLLPGNPWTLHSWNCPLIYFW